MLQKSTFAGILHVFHVALYGSELNRSYTWRLCRVHVTIWFCTSFRAVKLAVERRDVSRVMSPYISRAQLSSIHVVIELTSKHCRTQKPSTSLPFLTLLHPSLFFPSSSPFVPYRFLFVPTSPFAIYSIIMKI
jgi:hypothetical protein